MQVFKSTVHGACKVQPNHLIFWRPILSMNS